MTHGRYGVAFAGEFSVLALTVAFTLLALTVTAGPARATDDGSHGMVRIPGGEFTMGRDVGGHADQRPAHRVHVSAFWLDETLVTVAQFRAYVDATGAITSAEQVGSGLTAVEGMKDWEWTHVAGATWRAPWGPASGIALADDMPVTMVSWKDAHAYCAHAGKRLPTEAEWEYAMRAGSSGTRYPWGNDEHAHDDSAKGIRARFNHWEGDGHEANTRADGYVYLSPVRAFPPNAWGVFDPVGNVWQWTADWYAPDTYALDAKAVTVDPRGPAEGTHKVARGGSWWCSATTCHGYGLFARGKTAPTAAYSNNGFRCARSA